MATMMAKPGRPWGVHSAMKRHPPCPRVPQDVARTRQERTRWKSALALGPLGALGTFGQPHRPAHDAVFEILVGDLVLAGPDLAAHRNAGRMHGVGIA